mmetsp:Transcript_32240/g.104139  ORF Transcript_32240/g.104139 Transcript_32240/m.104139 type:complete len:210 (+) Transcript_32240:1136-1765(+)
MRLDLGHRRLGVGAPASPKRFRARCVSLATGRRIVGTLDSLPMRRDWRTVVARAEPLAVVTGIDVGAGNACPMIALLAVARAAAIPQGGPLRVVEHQSTLTAADRLVRYKCDPTLLAPPPFGRSRLAPRPAVGEALVSRPFGRVHLFRPRGYHRLLLARQFDRRQPVLKPLLERGGLLAPCVCIRRILVPWRAAVCGRFLLSHCLVRRG